MPRLLASRLLLSLLILSSSVFGSIPAQGSEGPSAPSGQNSTRLLSAASDLDSGFGTSGVATLDFGGADEIQALAVQSDGKIVAAGKTGSPGNFAIARFTTTGQPDTTFNGTGKVTVDFGGDDTATSVAVNGTDIFVGGNTYDSGASKMQWSLVKLTANGAPDGSFGSGGKVTTDVGTTSSASIHGLVIQPNDGKIVVVGYRLAGANYVFNLARYLTNGAPDSSFGGGASGRILVMGGVGQAVAMQGTNIIAGGTANFGTANPGMAVARVTSTGAPDVTFGTNGVTTTTLATSLSGIAFQSDGKIIAAGMGNNVFATARFGANGGLDSSYGGTGVVTKSAGFVNNNSAGVAVQADDKVLTGGPVCDCTTDVYFTAIRYTKDGANDSSFGSGGTVQYAPPNTSQYGKSMNAIVLQSDGKILLAGRRLPTGGDYDFAILRLNGDPTAPAKPAATPLANVPLGATRSALTKLAELNGSPEELASWVNPRVAAVYPLYRMDITGPAYFEYAIESQSLLSTQYAPAGYIIVSNGQHDFPIAHWYDQGPSLVERLYSQARLAGKTATKFFKVDALYYVAEDAGGSQVATLGNVPLKLTGIQTQGRVAAASSLTEISSSSWTPDYNGPDQTDTPTTGTTVVTGTQGAPAGVTVDTWADWNQLKTDYATTYAAHLAALASSARTEWAAIDNAARYGEVLRSGEVRDLMLAPIGTPSATLSGAGATLVQGQQQTAGSAAIFRITVNTPLPAGETPLTVTIGYGPGISESLLFILTDLPVPATTVIVPAAFTGRSISAPVANAAQTAAVPAAVTNGKWSKTQYYNASTAADQRNYGQFTQADGPLGHNCLSGCGPTAWAMLIGWVDFRATDPNVATWQPRKLIYRKDGGRSSVDEVAPATMTDGVRNMVLEIRRAVNLFCNVFNDSGATKPWDMKGVTSYTTGRSAVKVTTDWNAAGIAQDALRDQVIDSIKNKQTPVVVGTGWLSHYPVAWRYSFRSRTVKNCGFFGCSYNTEEERQFFVNQGWEGSDNSWVPASTWFSGRITA